MSDDEINKAINEACGWDHNPVNCGGSDFCSDLNAMHEAEKFLFREKMAHRYFLFLTDFWRGNKSNYCFHSTARQRAEAFLRTLGKWEEAK
jgi:hypothetical protein